MIPPIIGEHFERFRQAHPGAEMSEVPGVSAVRIEVPDVPLSDEWNRKSTRIRFLVPLAYPSAPPDCFWADAGVALKGDVEPKGANHQPIPGTTESLRWFSWHVQQWNPNAHTISSFFQVILDRLRTAE